MALSKVFFLFLFIQKRQETNELHQATAVGPGVLFF